MVLGTVSTALFLHCNFSAKSACAGLRNAKSLETYAMPNSFKGIPTFFRLCCRDCSRGGQLGYDHPGRELGRHTLTLIPHGVDYREWMDEDITELENFLIAEDNPAVLRWFLTRFPKCLALVPKRRRPIFLRGLTESLQSKFGIESEEDTE